MDEASFSGYYNILELPMFPLYVECRGYVDNLDGTGSKDKGCDFDSAESVGSDGERAWTVEGRVTLGKSRKTGKWRFDRRTPAPKDLADIQIGGDSLFRILPSRGGCF